MEKLVGSLWFVVAFGVWCLPKQLYTNDKERKVTKDCIGRGFLSYWPWDYFKERMKVSLKRNKTLKRIETERDHKDPCGYGVDFSFGACECNVVSHVIDEIATHLVSL